MSETPKEDLIGVDTARMEDRERYWSELSQCEKSDRMRGIVRSLLSRVDDMQRELEQLAQHQHDPSSGELLFRARRMGGLHSVMGSPPTMMDDGKVYF